MTTINELRVPSNTQPGKSTAYYKVQMRAWTNVDPDKLTLKQLAEFIEAGRGVLTAIEVVKVADDLNAVDDIEVRETFQSIRAAERILDNVDALPLPLRQKLQSALTSKSGNAAVA